MKEKDTKKKEKKQRPEEFHKLKQQHEELKDSHLRLSADYQNFMRRMEIERQVLRQTANENILRKILPIIDNFELALESKDKGEDFIKGIELIYAQLTEVLSEEGLKQIEAKGKFDPSKHEAVLVEESDKEPSTILEELQKGYKIGNKIVRHSKVKIAKKRQGGNEK